jgi:hypothetical protein
MKDLTFKVLLGIIAENHPGLYELLTRYLPTEPWDYCPGVTEYMRTQ